MKGNSYGMVKRRCIMFLHGNLYLSVAKISIIWPSVSKFSKQCFSPYFSIQLELFTSDTKTREKSRAFSVATCIILYLLYLALWPGLSHLLSPVRISDSPFNMVHTGLMTFYSRTFPGLLTIFKESISTSTISHLFNSHFKKAIPVSVPLQIASKHSPEWHMLTSQ